MAVFWSIIAVFWSILKNLIYLYLILSFIKTLFEIRFSIIEYFYYLTSGSLRDIEHFRRRVDRCDATITPWTGKPHNSDRPPCSKCSVKIQQGKIVFDQHNEQACNALHIASEVEAFNKSPFTPLQLKAHQQFQTLSRDRSSSGLFRRLGAGDARRVSEDEYIHLLGILTAMFFPGTISYEFGFHGTSSRDLKMYGSSVLKENTALVRLHSIDH
jgi:hypothetical protein